MAKDKVDKEKKKEKKEKRAEKDGVHKTSKKDKKAEKKDKKGKTVLAEAVDKEVTGKVLDGLEAEPPVTTTNGDVELVQTEAESRPVGAVVPFANPLVTDKSAKKVLKSVKKGMMTLHVQFRGSGCFYFPKNDF